jgi:hypothetical protein
LNKSDRLNLALDELHEQEGVVDVICLSEHYMKRDEADLLKIPGYKMAACFCRTKEKGKKEKGKKENRGGVCILLRENI